MNDSKIDQIFHVLIIIRDILIYKDDINFLKKVFIDLSDIGKSRFKKELN